MMTKKGDVAGYINDEGYRIINIDGKDYYSHDLAFMYMAGEFAKGKAEHINGKKDDDTWSNLRDREKARRLFCTWSEVRSKFRFGRN